MNLSAKMLINARIFFFHIKLSDRLWNPKAPYS